MKRRNANVALRCNAHAYAYSPSNGYRACRDHAKDGMLLCSEAGPAPHGRCDKSLEGVDPATIPDTMRGVKNGVIVDASYWLDIDAIRNR